MPLSGRIRISRVALDASTPNFASIGPETDASADELPFYCKSSLSDATAASDEPNAKRALASTRSRRSILAVIARILLGERPCGRDIIVMGSKIS